MASPALITAALVPGAGLVPLASASGSGLDQQITSGGSPVANTPVSVVALPIDTSYWPAAEPYPVVGSGQTDGNGMVTATTDPGLDGIQGKPAFETEAGSITLAVEYTALDGSTVQAYTAQESLPPYPDPALAQQTVGNANGPLAGASLTVYAEPEYTQQWPQRASLPELATCRTDALGHPQCSLDLSSVQGDGAFLHNGVLTYDVWYQDSTGAERLAFRAQEYVWGGWDPALWQQLLADAHGQVLGSTPVVLRAEPANPSSWSGGAYPEVGSGTSDSSGYVHANFSPGALLDGPAFMHEGGLTLDVDYQDASGAWQTATTDLQQLGPQPDPVMHHEVVRDASGHPELDTTLLARLEPVDPSSWTGAYPLVGAGATDDAGRALLTPALEQYIGNAAFETTNGYMVVDLYSQAEDGTPTLVTRLPYYLGAQEDPLLLRTQVLDAGGNPVPNKRLVIRAEPQAASSAVARFVGGGYSDAGGMAHASIDLTHVSGNANYQSSSGGVTLDVYYWDGGVLNLGATVQRDLTQDGETLEPPSDAPISSVYQASADASGAGTPTLSAPLDALSLGPASPGVSSAGILGVDAFSPAGVYQGPATEYVGPAPASQTYANIVDVTQQPGGGTEYVGCLESSASQGDPYYGDCVWSNPNTDTIPTADTAVTATGVPSSSAVTVVLRWSDIVQMTGSAFNPTNLTRVDNEVAQILKYGKKIVLVPFFLSAYSSAAGGWATISQVGNPGSTTEYTYDGGSACPTVGEDVQASGAPTAPAYVQSGTVQPSSTCSKGNGTVVVGWDTFTGGEPYVGGQTELNWGCDTGTLPDWEVGPKGVGGNLNSDPGNLQAVCDGKGTHDMMPDYWSYQFQTDWDGFVSQIAQYFDCKQGSGTPGTICADPVDSAYDESDVLYVRAGLGLTDEGQPYEQSWSTASGSLKDQSNIKAQLLDWAQERPPVCQAAQQVIQDSPNLAGYFDGWQRCRLTDDYIPDFSYAPVMYPITDLDELEEPPNEWVAEDVATWALGKGIAVGSNGLNYGWVFDHNGYGDGTLDNPPQSLTPQVQIIQALWDDE